MQNDSRRVRAGPGGLSRQLLSFGSSSLPENYAISTSTTTTSSGQTTYTSGRTSKGAQNTSNERGDVLGALLTAPISTIELRDHADLVELEFDLVFRNGDGGRSVGSSLGRMSRGGSAGSLTSLRGARPASPACTEGSDHEGEAPTLGHSRSGFRAVSRPIPIPASAKNRRWRVYSWDGTGASSAE
eukprot:tig00020629_g12457.t1